MRQDIRSFVERLDRLPTLSPVAIQLIDVAARGDVGMRDISRLISCDQSLTARLLKIANSAAFGFREVRTLQRATALLGLDMLRSIALSVIVLDLFPDKSRTSFDLEAFWRHNAACAIGCEALAGRLNYPDPREAFLAGLLHDIGKLVLHHWNPSLYGEIVEEAEQAGTSLLEVEERTLGVGHTWVARLLMQSWRFPEALVDSAWLHHQPLSQLQKSGQALALSVSCANTLCHLFRYGASGNPASPPELEEASAATGLSVTQLVSISGQIVERYDEVASQFNWPGSGSELCRESVLKANQEMARLHLQLEERNRKLSRKQDLMEALFELQTAQSSSTAPGMLSRMIELSPRSAPLKRAAVFIIQEESSELAGRHWSASQPSAKEMNLPLEADLAARLSRMSQREQVSAIIQALRSAATPQSKEVLELLYSASLIVAPLKCGKQCLGQLFADLDCLQEQQDEFAESVRRYALSAAHLLDRMCMESQLERKDEQLARMARQARTASNRLFQAERLASVGRLAAGAAHEINNPLTIISAQAQLLEANSDSPQNRKALRNICSQSERIAKIVKDLMGLARPAKPQTEPTSIPAVLERTLDVLSTRFRNAGIRIETQIDCQVPDILADPKQLEQVFLNLSINAVQAMQEGGRLEIRLSTGQDPAGETLCVDFADSGHGIDQQHLESIFDPFFSTKAEGEGMGLGLAICYSIVQSHGGQLSVKSQKGVGTTFTVTLPTRGAPASSPVQTQPESPLLGFALPTARRTKVLLIDDEKALAQLLQECLSAEGYRVDTAFDAQAALRSVSQLRPDVAVMDLKIPGVKGLDLLEDLRRQRPGLPVIVMTGSTDPADRTALRSCKAASCLFKPFEPAQLSRSIEQAISGIPMQSAGIVPFPRHRAASG